MEGLFEKVVSRFSISACRALIPPSTVLYGAHRLHRRHSEGLPSYQTSQSNTPLPSLADLSAPKQKQGVKMDIGSLALIPVFQGSIVQMKFKDMVYKNGFFSIWKKKSS